MDIHKSRLYAESWNIAYRFKPEGTILTDALSEFTIIPNPAKYWAADPMIFCHNGETFLFAELFDYTTSKGVIGVCKYENRRFSKWTVIIEENTHLSYPFVFKNGNEVYMIPESSDSKQLVLYRSTDFPYKWEKEKVIKDDIQLVDTTIVRKDGGYFGFTETRDVPPIDYSINLDESFSDIKLTKIKNGGDNKHRCGGRMFYYDSKLVCVCQDCVENYGKGLYFRVLDNKLNESEEYYIGTEKINLNKKILMDGIHTYTATDKMEVIDIKTRRFSIINFLFRFFGKIKNILAVS